MKGVSLPHQLFQPTDLEYHNHYLQYYLDIAEFPEYLTIL